MGIIYAVGCAAIIIFGLATIAANIVNMAVIDCDDKLMNGWLKTTSFLEALTIMGLLIYFTCKVI